MKDDALRNGMWFACKCYPVSYKHNQWYSVGKHVLKPIYHGDNGGWGGPGYVTFEVEKGLDLDEYIRIWEFIQEMED